MALRNGGSHSEVAAEGVPVGVCEGLERGGSPVVQG